MTQAELARLHDEARDRAFTTQRGLSFIEKR
jgi:hypothetical protein